MARGAVEDCQFVDALFHTKQRPDTADVVTTMHNAERSCRVVLEALDGLACVHTALLDTPCRQILINAMMSGAGEIGRVIRYHSGPLILCRREWYRMSGVVGPQDWFARFCWTAKKTGFEWIGPCGLVTRWTRADVGPKLGEHSMSYVVVLLRSRRATWGRLFRRSPRVLRSQARRATLGAPCPSSLG